MDRNNTLIIESNTHKGRSITRVVSYDDNAKPSLECYRTLNDVNIASPSVCSTDPHDEYATEYYKSLQYSLHENNLPRTVVRTDTPRHHAAGNDVTIAILSAPCECLSVLLSGSQRSPGDMLLILSATWLKKVPSPKADSLFSLFVHKAITFDSGGRTFLDVYDPPRRVTYFMNFFTTGITEGRHGEGELISKDIDCPTSSSPSLAAMVDDKLWTRTLFAEVKCKYPETLAFTFLCQRSYNDSYPDISIVKLDTKCDVSNKIEEGVQRFVNAEYMAPYDKVAVKPSGSIWFGSEGVTYHRRSDVSAIKKAILDLLQDIQPQNSILVEAFHSHSGAEGSQVHGLSVCIRSIVCRGFGNEPCSTTLICGVGKKQLPVNGDNTIPQTMDTTLKMWGISNPLLRKSVTFQVKKHSQDLLQKVIEHESTMTTNERGGTGEQTDLIGLDFVFGDIDGQLTPVAIEVNSYDCTIPCQIFESINPNNLGTSAAPLVDTMVERSQKYIMRGKRILVIAAGGSSKRFIWDAAKSYGIKIILVDSTADKRVLDTIEEFHEYDFSDHTLDRIHAENIANLVEDYVPTLHGCCTFWEDCGPLSAMICDKLGFCGPGLEGSIRAKKKKVPTATLR